MGSALYSRTCVYSLGHQNGLFELGLWFPASITGPDLFSFEANKWTQLKLEPALLFSIAFTHKLRIFLRPSHGLSIVFTHKLRIFLRPTNGLRCTIINLLFKLRLQISLYLQKFCR